MKDVIELLHNIGKLKEVKRAGWIIGKIPNPESVADHSFRTAVMALLLSNKMGLNRDKCVQMALIHDLSESLAGDITPHDKISSEEKYKIERKAMESLFEKVNGNNIIQLWEEYTKNESPESKFVRQLDKIETLLQALEYEKKYQNEKVDLNEFWDYAKDKIKDPLMLDILELLRKEKDNIE